MSSQSRQGLKFDYGSAIRSQSIIQAKMQEIDLEYSLQPMMIPEYSARLITKKETAEQYCECIGVIRSEWVDQRTKEVKSICYGSAFAVASRLLITCGHNVHNEEDNKPADRCVFIPNHKGNVLEETVKYHSAQGVFCKYIPPKQGVNLSSRPTPNQICVLVTEKDIVITNKYISIGLCNVKPNEQVEIIGYPSRQFSTKANILQVNMKRKVTEGKVDSIRGSIKQGQFMAISYNLKTKKGMSGSPILYCHNGKIHCVGIHTHGREEGMKSGVFFNEFAILTIKGFQQQLSKLHNLTSKIQYYFIKEQSLKKNKQIQQQLHIGGFEILFHNYYTRKRQLPLPFDKEFEQVYQKINKQIQTVIKPWLYDPRQHDPSRVIHITKDEYYRLKFPP